tara:strand:- start:4852 stop:5445 length:594 start_codon:yes stop_codon:yes gene_type:complete
MKAALLHYSVGNIRHLISYFKSLNINLDIVDSEINLDIYDLLVLPGVGSYNSSMEFLNKNNLSSQIIKHYNDSKKIIGICLGFQILGKSSNENNISTNGLGIFNIHFKHLSQFKGYNNHKIPHIGWNNNFKSEFKYYYLHSYASEEIEYFPSDQIEIVDYDEINFISMIKTSNILATQFHPEMSDGNFDRHIMSFLS